MAWNQDAAGFEIDVALADFQEIGGPQLDIGAKPQNADVNSRVFRIQPSDLGKYPCLVLRFKNLAITHHERSFRHLRDMLDPSVFEESFKEGKKERAQFMPGLIAHSGLAILEPLNL